MLNTDMLSMQNMQEYGDEKSMCIICKICKRICIHTRHIHIPCFYMTLITNMTEYAKKFAEYAHPHFRYKKIVKYEKNAKYFYLTSGLPTEGRPSVKVKNMHNITKYVEYAENGSEL